MICHIQNLNAIRYKVMKTLKEIAPELNIVKAYVALANHIVSKG